MYNRILSLSRFLDHLFPSQRGHRSIQGYDLQRDTIKKDEERNRLRHISLFRIDAHYSFGETNIFFFQNKIRSNELNFCLYL